MRHGLRAALSLAVFFLVRPAAATIDFPVEVRVEADTYRYRVLEVKFPSSEPSLFKNNATVWGHLYVPRREGKDAIPCVLVLPIMAEPNSWIEMRFVHALLMSRIAVMWIEMPYQYHRRPREDIPSGQVFLARSARRLGLNFRQAAADARRSLTWLQASGLVDARRIGLMGISLGALVGSYVMSVDSRPRAAVLVLGGADLPGLVEKSEMTSDFVRAAGIKKEDLREAWKGLEAWDYRDSNAGKRVLLINARGDRVIPEENARKLHEAFPGSRQIWIPFGHYGAILHFVWLPSYVAYRFKDLLR